MASKSSLGTSSKSRILSKVRVYWSDHRLSYLLVLPTILAIVVLLWLPFLRGIWMSFHQWPFVGNPQWVGLENYTMLFTWDVFYTSLRATLIFSSATAIQLGVALAAALLVANTDTFENVLSGAYILPYTMPPVVTGTIWLYLLDPSVGPLFDYLIDFGLLDQPIFWTVSGDASLAVITLITAWTFWPFMFLILLASRQNIPSEHYEAAKVYGASRLQMLWRVTIPQLKSAILVAVSIRLIWNLSKISQPLQITGGGPGFDTSILGILLYRFTAQEGALGRAYAIGIVLLIITLSFVILFIREFERSHSEVSDNA